MSAYKLTVALDLLMSMMSSGSLEKRAYTKWRQSQRI